MQREDCSRLGVAEVCWIWLQRDVVVGHAKKLQNFDGFLLWVRYKETQ